MAERRHRGLNIVLSFAIAPADVAVGSGGGNSTFIESPHEGIPWLDSFFALPFAPLSTLPALSREAALPRRGPGCSFAPTGTPGYTLVAFPAPIPTKLR